MTSPPSLLLFAIVLALAMAPGDSRAEKADRSQPMVIEADHSAVVDTQHQVLVYTGNVVISQGSMLLRAERIEMHELPDGYRSAGATGGPGKPVTWRQRRDGMDETVEGSARRIEFDGRADTLRLVGDSILRLRRAGTVTHEASGGVIVWNNMTEVFKVEGGTATAVNPTGRVRAVLTPPAAPASASRPAPTAPLTPSLSLGDKR